MATYRSLGYDSFIIRSIRSGLFPHEGEDEAAIISNYGDLGFNYSLTRRDLVLPGFSAFETRNMFPDGAISYQQLSSYIGQDYQGWKWIDDEAPVAGATETAWISPSSNTQHPAGSGAGWWVNQTNAYSSDDSYASCAPARYAAIKKLGLYSFDFSSIPEGATITGLEMKIDCYKSGIGNATTLSFSISANENIVPNNDQCYYANSLWPAAEDTITLGGNGVLWDQPINKDYLNACAAWVEVYRPSGIVTFYVDWMRLKAYYTT